MPRIEKRGSQHVAAPLHIKKIGFYEKPFSGLSVYSSKVSCFGHDKKQSVNFCPDRGSRLPIPKTRKPTDKTVSVSCLLVWDYEIVEISVHLKSKNASKLCIYYYSISLFLFCFSCCFY